MKLRVLDTIQVTAIRADCLRPNEVIDIDSHLATELLKKHPAVFEQHESAQKSAQAPNNKMAQEHSDKAVAPDYSKSTVADLNALASSRGVDLGNCKNKADVIAALEAADVAGSEGSDGREE